jgi:hypothetical protein
MTTWNPSDKSANVTLSNGNLTVGASTGADGGVRSNLSKATGKVYFEYTVVNIAGGDTGVGIATGTASLTAIGPFATGAISIYGSGSIYFNGSDTGKTIGGSVGTICIAVDITGGLFWARWNAGNWNGSGTANPATGVGGINIAALFPTNAVFASNSTNNTAVNITVNFGATAFAQTAPSGFTAWDSGTILNAGLVTDSETFYAPGVTASNLLLPLLIASDDAFHAPTLAAGAVTFLPTLVSDADAFYAPGIANTSQFLQPAAGADTDTFYAPSIVAQQIPEQVLQPGLVAADDVIVTASVSGRNELQPALLVDPDDIATVNAGWRLFGQLLVDVDLIRSPHVETLTYLLPETINDETESVDNYPFFIQGVTGGIPVPPPSGVLTGSISHKRLTGSLGHRPQLTGSLKRRAA